MTTRRSALSIALLAAAAPLLARASEGVLGLAPCELCLWQRWPYWVAAVLADPGRRLLYARVVVAADAGTPLRAGETVRWKLVE